MYYIVLCFILQGKIDKNEDAPLMDNEYNQGSTTPLKSTTVEDLNKLNNKGVHIRQGSLLLQEVFVNMKAAVVWSRSCKLLWSMNVEIQVISFFHWEEES